MGYGAAVRRALGAQTELTAIGAQAGLTALGLEARLIALGASLPSFGVEIQIRRADTPWGVFVAGAWAPAMLLRLAAETGLEEATE